MIYLDVGRDRYAVEQADLAKLSARFASHVGHGRFRRLEDRRIALLAAIEQHNAGWSEIDAAPPVDARGRPVDVFHALPENALFAWRTSADRTEVSAGPYAGLLVSLHGLALSVRANGPAVDGRTKFDLSNPHALFALNRFQHGEIERQERLRESLGFPTDVPLRHGLADPGASPADDRLLHHFRWLEAADLLSDCVCSTHLIASETGEVSTAVGAGPITLRLARDVGGTLRVSPWPFDVPRLEGTIPARRLRSGPYGSAAELQSALTQTERLQLPFTIRP